MKKFYTKLGIFTFLLLIQFTAGAQKRLYVANDDHTDFMLYADSASYVDFFVKMLDRWMYINDSTKAAEPLKPNLHNKWNCDGSYWIALYEKRKGPGTPGFDSLIRQIKDGQVTVPYSPLIIVNGGIPIEGVLRGMYYAGSLERRFGLDLNMATAMENQVLPLGLSSLWKGSGAKYAWHGVCNCDTKIDHASFGSREREMYWYKGMDTNKILLKWYKMQQPTPYGNTYLGGYAEMYAAHNNISIDDIAAKCNTLSYPYNIAGAFGVGHDHLFTLTDELVNAARAKTIPGVQTVIVSNEVDFFQDFENTYQPQNKIDTLTKTFGNEWDLNCTSISEVSDKIKRALEKLRAAEAMAAIEINFNVTLMEPVIEMRKLAWESIGMYWEHSLGFGNNNVSLLTRNAFQRRLERDITNYADALYTLAKKGLALRISKGNSTNTRFFAFNPLGWIRTDYADFRYNVNNNIKVIDVSTSLEVPFQFITKNGESYLRVLASNIPSVGYKAFEIVTTAGIGFPNAGTNTGNIVESDSFRITYTNAGVLTSVIDKRNGNKELVEAGKYLNDLGSGNANTGTSVVEYNGPVSITILTTSSVPKQHETRITLYTGIGRVEIDNKITENFNDSVRTWTYAFNITTPEVWHEETGAVIKAKLTTNGGHYSTQNARYDWNTLNHFASVNENGGGYGVSLSNQDCYFMQIGNSTVTTLDENSARLKVLAGGTIGGLGILNQGGDIEFNQRFAITTHTSYNAPAEMKKALEHQNAFVTDTIISQVNFLLPEQFSFVSTNDPATVIWGVKPAEDGVTSGIVTRVWNLANTDAAPTLTYGLSFNSAYRTTHVETDIEQVTVPAGGNALAVSLGHNEMKTFRVLTFAVSLPVKLFSFTGYRAANSTQNELRWNTDSEKELKEYIIERSADGNSFAPLATVPKNNGTYLYADEKVNTALAYYYRLKMVNSYGRFVYSNIVYIRADKDAANLLVFPNPASDIINTSIVLNQRLRCNVSFINAAGAVVKTTVTPLFERGHNTYSFSVKELAAGNYNLVINAGDKKYVQPFIKR